MVRRNTSAISAITVRAQKPSPIALPDVPHGVMNPANRRSFREVSRA